MQSGISKIYQNKRNFIFFGRLEINYSSYVTCDYTLYDDLKKKTFRKGIIIFKINDDNDSDDIITVGRSQNNKIKLKDISVSRNHCNFVKKKNKLYIVTKVANSEL